VGGFWKRAGAGPVWAGSSQDAEDSRAGPIEVARDASLWIVHY
jgi:hypothetical protein